MQITLSTKPLGLEAGVKGRNVTCQYVMIRRKNNPKSVPKAVASKEGEGTKVSKEDGADKQKDDTAQSGKDVGEKRKIESSQASTSDPIRGGKKRKK